MVSEVVDQIDHLHSGHLSSGAILLIDKPIGWTSFDVVNKIRFAIKHKLKTRKYKVGHAGTLDPLASGLLLVCIGSYTKRIESLVAEHKGYKCEITLGAHTPSYDAETKPDIYYPKKVVTQEHLNAVIPTFKGLIEQVPPMYSAVKVKGQKLYSLARRGQELQINPRQVEIYRVDLRMKNSYQIQGEVLCSKGTYIRSLAKDIGESLNTGGYLSLLQRTSIGEYHVDHALSIDQIIQQIESLEIPITIK